MDGGNRVYPDLKYTETLGEFEIITNGRFVKLVTDFGLVVETDGDLLTIVKVPQAFAGKMAGLCGNADGIAANDWIASDGTDLTNSPNNYLLLGNSWQIVPDLLDPT